MVYIAIQTQITKLQQLTAIVVNSESFLLVYLKNISFTTPSNRPAILGYRA